MNTNLFLLVINCVWNFVFYFRMLWSHWACILIAQGADSCHCPWCFEVTGMTNAFPLTVFWQFWANIVVCFQQVQLIVCIYLYYCRTQNPTTNRQHQGCPVLLFTNQAVSTHVIGQWKQDTRNQGTWRVMSELSKQNCPQCKDAEHRWTFAPQEEEKTSGSQSIG